MHQREAYFTVFTGEKETKRGNTMKTFDVSQPFNQKKMNNQPKTQTEAPLNKIQEIERILKEIQEEEDFYLQTDETTYF